MFSNCSKPSTQKKSPQRSLLFFAYVAVVSHATYNDKRANDAIDSILIDVHRHNRTTKNAMVDYIPDGTTVTEQAKRQN